MDDEMEKNWGYASWDTFFAILPESELSRLLPMYMVKDCTTWGEVADLGDEIMKKVLGMAGYGTLEQYTAHLKITGAVPLPGVNDLMAETFDADAEVPGPEDPFDIGTIPAYSDGDFPPSPYLLMSEYVPSEVVEEFGRGYDTTFSGYFTEFPAEAQDDVIAWFKKAGYTVTPSSYLYQMIDPDW